MTVNKILDKIKEDELMCSYCVYENECPRGWVCYGGSPIEPPCINDTLTDIIDIEAYCDDYEVEVEQ